jgi:hypothetical protein
MNASPASFIKDVAGFDFSCGSDKHLTRLENALRTIADSIAVARKVMHEVEVEITASVSGNGLADTEVPVLEEDRREVDQAIARLVSADNLEDAEEEFRQLIMDYLDIDGWVAAGVLSSIIRLPGRFMSHTDIARAAGVQSDRSTVVRVYICQLRNSLVAKGYSSGAIETGRGAYRIVRSAAFEIVNALADDINSR